MTQPGSPVAEPPRLVVVGGPNGAGKTTLALEYADAHGLRYLGADDIAARLDPSDPAAARVRAARAFSRGLRAVIDAGESLVIESTLSGGSLQAHLERARQAGHRITLAMVFLDSEEACLRRVAQRVANGGHDVPEADVRRRFRRSIRQFMTRYRGVAHEWVVSFNGESGHVLVADGTGNHVDMVFDDTLWSRFQALAAKETEDGETDSL